MKMRWVGAVLLVVVAVQPLFAHDLGTQGTTYPIVEPSLLVQMMEKLASIDWHKKSEQLLQSAKDSVHDFAQDGLTAARETKTEYIDPSITLKQPISAPVKAPDGKSTWRVIYPAGTRVNPLDKVQPVTRMLVFNPASKTQTAFAIAAMHAWPTLIELVATGGDVAGLSKKIQRPVFYATEAFVRRFGVTHTPSLIGVGEGALKRRLAVTAFGPADANEKEAVRVVRAAWYGLKPLKEGLKDEKNEKSHPATRGGVTAIGNAATHKEGHSWKH